MRILILIHRYLGIAVGLVMAMWCVSGFVMMYVSYPALDNAKRLQALQPINWQGCCAYQKIAVTLGVNVVDDFSVEMVAGKPVLSVKMALGTQQAFDLQSGALIESLTREQAEAVVQHYASVHAANAKTQYREQLTRDQWTVSGVFNRDRPLHHIAIQDSVGTELYVSNTTGEIVQNTTARERFWNWLGAVPHWLYPTALRQHSAVWSQVVIWLSLIGTFLTVVGLYIGIVQWRAMKGKRWSPYRGVNLWHHIGGLFFGLFTLTWVASGLISMSPWGFLDGEGFKEERDRVRDVWIDGSQIVAALQGLANSSTTLSATRIESAPLNGKLYLIIYNGTQSQRVDAKTGELIPLAREHIERAAAQLLPDAKVAHIDFLTIGDNYYYSGHDARSLPVYRVTISNADRTRYYLDPQNGDVVDKVDANRRWYRWLFEGLHRWDFSVLLRTRPWWDLLVVPLMLGVTVVCFAGVYMGYRRVMPRTRP